MKSSGAGENEKEREREKETKNKMIKHFGWQKDYVRLNE